MRLEIEEGQVEPSIVCDEHRVTRELEEPSDRRDRARLPSKLRISEAGEGADCRPDGNARVDERLENLSELQLAYAHGADLADARTSRTQSGRLEIHHHEGGVLEQKIRSGWVGEPDCIATPGQANVVADDVVEQHPGQPNRCVAKGEQTSRGLLGVHRPAPFLDEFHQPVGRVKPELHTQSLCERMFDSKRAVALTPNH